MLYRMFDAQGVLLYIGKTINFFRRIDNHGRDKAWLKDVVNITCENYDTHRELLTAERSAIRAEKPFYNIVHNRDRSARALSKVL